MKKRGEVTVPQEQQIQTEATDVEVTDLDLLQAIDDLLRWETGLNTKPMFVTHTPFLNLLTCAQARKQLMASNVLNSSRMRTDHICTRWPLTQVGKLKPV